MSPLERLQHDYPWPAICPKIEPSQRGWDGGGRELITDAITARGVRLIVEVGSFLGLSARTWLATAKDVTVICVDPWLDVDVRQWGLHDWPELFGKNLYATFLASCWEYRDRLIPYRGTSPEVFFDLRARGLAPDLIYIDGDHNYSAVKLDLRTCRRLFPQAWLCGDDWSWTAERFPPRSVREAVQDFAAAYQLEIISEGNTWRLDSLANDSLPSNGWSWLTSWLRRQAS